MEVNILGKVGAGRAGLPDAVHEPLRLGKLGELIVGNLHDQNFEAALRGQSFIGNTAIGGVAPGTALSTTPPIVLYNPIGSNVVASLSKVQMSFLSGTFGAGNVVLGVCPISQSILSVGTDLAPVSTQIPSSIKPTCRLLQAPTLPNAPVMVKTLWYTGAFVTNATDWMMDREKLIDGEFILAPGGALALQMIGAAGTSPLALFSMSWKEFPIVPSK